MWKPLIFFLGLMALPVAAQTSVDTRGLGTAWTDLGPPVGNRLALDLEAAGVAILPSEDGHVRARSVGTKNLDLSRVRLRFEPSGNPAELRLSHTPRNGFQIEIQVPRAIALTLRMSAGEVRIQGVEGDKDLRLHAGEIIVQVGDPNTYGPVSASVWAGEIKPGPFGEAKEGLFRSFHHEGPGRYSLQVKVKAGEVTFQK
jgi:hypothetical protein